MSEPRGAEQYRSGVVSFSSAGQVESSAAERIHEFQTEYSSLWFAACDAVRHETQRSILTALQDGMGSCTRQEINDWVSVGDRTVRKHLQKLEERGLVDRVDSRSHAVSYASFEVDVLVSHALECYYG